MTYLELKQWCELNNIGIVQMEKDLGIARGSLSKMDKHKPSMDKIEKIANYVGLPISAFVTVNPDYEFPLTNQEKEIIKAFRKSEHKDAILTLLGLEDISQKKENLA